MTHAIQAVIVSPEAADEVRRELTGARAILLPQGFWLVPIVRADPPAFPGAKVRGFYDLTKTLLAHLRRVSIVGPVAYVETEYFGGPGGQAAIVLRDGVIEYVGSNLEDEEIGDDEDSISIALGALGVEPGSSRDEFDALGLGTHRTNDAWLAASR